MKKLDDFFVNFKNDIKTKSEEFGLYHKDNNNETNENINKLIQFVFDYKRFDLTKDDFLKRKRSKSSVENSERCCAKRANGEQCTRRKKENDLYCGTHIKGIPHGYCGETESNDDKIVENKQHAINIWAQEIKGIIFYIDSEFNVYKMEDIMSNKHNPEIIAKYIKGISNGSDTYSIPELNI